jgi:antitoxin VapB
MVDTKRMDTAKLFKSGRSQAVRLPKEFRFEGDEVAVTRLGAAVVLLPKNHDWEVLFGTLDGFGEDFMVDRAQPALQERSFDAP